MPVVVTTHALAHGVDELGRLDAGDAGVGGLHRPLELEGQVDLLAGREVGQRRPEQVELGHGHAVGLGQAEVLVGGGEAGVVAGLGERLGEDVVVEAAGVGEALPVADDDPHADALRLGRRQRLDLALVGPHLGVARPPDDASTCSPSLRRADDPVGDVEQVARHAGGRTLAPLMPRCRRRSAGRPAGSARRRRPARPGRPCRTCPGSPWRSRCRGRRCPAAPSGRCR